MKACHRVVREWGRVNGVTIHKGAMDAFVAAAEGVSKPLSWLKSVLKSIQPSRVPQTILTSAIAREAIRESRQTNADLLRQHILVPLTASAIPCYTFDPSKRQWQLRDMKQPLTAADRAAIGRSRFHMIQERVERSDTFRRAYETFLSSLVGQSDAIVLTTIDSLRGSSDEKVVLGMIGRDAEHYVLEDANGKVVMRFDDKDAVTGNMFTETCIVLAAGKMVGNVYHVSYLTTPMAEPKAAFLRAHPKVDLFGAAPVDTKVLEALHAHEQTSNDMIVVLSDVWLDRNDVLLRLDHMFTGFADNVPLAFVLMGNFWSHEVQTTADRTAYTQAFVELGRLIAKHPQLAKTCTFIIAPGPHDAGHPAVWPRPPIPAVFVRGLRSRVANIHFVSNPFRLRWCTREIVLFRENLLQKMRRHVMFKPPDQANEDSYEALVRTLLDQAHLCPLPLDVFPIQWRQAHALSLSPAPDVLIIADKYEQHSTTYQDTLAFNPGVFGSDYSFVAFYPGDTDPMETVQYSHVVLPEDGAHMGAQDADVGVLLSADDAAESQADVAAALAYVSRKHDRSRRSPTSTKTSSSRGRRRMKKPGASPVHHAAVLPGQSGGVHDDDADDDGDANDGDDSDEVQRELSHKVLAVKSTAGANARSGLGLGSDLLSADSDAEGEDSEDGGGGGAGHAMDSEAAAAAAVLHADAGAMEAYVVASPVKRGAGPSGRKRGANVVRVEGDGDDDDEGAAAAAVVVVLPKGDREHVVEDVQDFTTQETPTMVVDEIEDDSGNDDEDDEDDDEDDEDDDDEDDEEDDDSSSDSSSEESIPDSMDEGGEE